MEVKLNRPQVSLDSREWLALEAWVREQLEETQKRLAGFHLTDVELRQQQGRASVFQQMLDFRIQAASMPPIKGELI